jgi:dolichol-phosphate mannosyltransferase
MSWVGPLTAWFRDYPGLSRRGLHALVVAFLLSAIVRFVAMAVVPLTPEEAYYWLYGYHAELSYFDHPPMVAWVIRAGTWVFGDTEFGVRVAGPLLMVGASLLLYQFGRMWFGRAAGLLAGLALHLLPVYFGTGFLATMDPPLLFFWALGLVAVSRALRSNSPGGWYLAGLAFGGAMLCKYTGAFLVVGGLLAVVGHRPWRRHLLTVHPYLAVLLGLALFSPVLVWNAQHEWVSFRFQFFDRAARKSPSAGSVLTFLAFQFLVLTPLLLWGAVTLYARVLRTRRRLLAPRWLVAVGFSLPLLAALAWKSRYEVHLNWSLPAFLALIPALAHLVLARMRLARAKGERSWWPRLLVYTAAACVAVNAVVAGALMVVPPRLQWFGAFGPWSELAQVVDEYEGRLAAETGQEPLVVGGGKYRLAAVLAFYRQSAGGGRSAAENTTSRSVFGGRPSGFQYWADPQQWAGRDCIWVVEREGAGDDIRAETRWMFESVEVVDDPRLRELGRGRYRIAVCRKLVRVPEPFPLADAPSLFQK